MVIFADESLLSELQFKSFFLFNILKKVTLLAFLIPILGIKYGFPNFPWLHTQIYCCFRFF